MTAPPTHQRLEAMAWMIDVDGIDAIPPASLRWLELAARGAGVNAGLVDLVLADDVPALVRERAFSAVAGALGRPAHRHSLTTLTPERVTTAA